MEEIGRLRMDLSIDSLNFENGLRGANQRLRALNSEMSAISTSTNRFENSLDTLRAKSDVLTRSFNTHQRKVEELRRQYEQSKQTKGEDAEETVRLLTAYNRAVSAMNRVENQLRAVNEQIAEQSNSFNRLRNRLNETGDSLKGFGEKATNAGQSLTAGLTVPLMGFGTMAAKTALDFDKASGSIQAELGISEKQAKELNDVAKELWEDGFGDSIEGVSSKIAGVTKSLGDLNKVDLTYITKGLDFFENKGWADQQETLRAMKVLMEQYGMSGSEAMDYITKGFQENLDYSGEFLDSISEYSTYYAEFGMSAEDMFAKFKAGAETGAFQLDKIGDAMKEFTLRSKSGDEASTEAFKSLGLNAKEMTKQFNKGGDEAQKAFAKVVKALQKTDNETEKNTASTGLFGTQYEDLGKKAFDAMLTASDGLDDVKGATKKASDAMRDNFGTRATKVWRDFVEDMEPVGEILLDIAEDALPKVADTLEDVTSAFTDLSPEAQKTVLTIGGIAAAAGPSVMAMGSLSTAIGGTMKVGASFVNLLGKAGGKGMIGRIGMLAPLATSPVGLAIAGTGALALGIYGLVEASKTNTEEIAKSIDKRQSEIDSMDKIIGKYEDLQTKNKLSSDEILRYMDIVDDLKNTKGEEAVKALTDEQSKLLKKSGLTNEEMKEFLELNDKIVEKAPSATKAISDQGNAYAGAVDELKKLNNAERERLVNDTYMAISDEMQKQQKNLEKQREIQNEIKSLEDQRKEANQGIIDYSSKIQAKNLEIADLKKEINKTTGEEKYQLLEKLAISQDDLFLLEGIRDKHVQTEESINGQIKKKQSSLEETNKELKAFDTLLDDYAQQVLYQEGIVSEKGKANEALKKEQKEIDTARTKLQELFKNQKISSSEYQSQNEQLNEQQNKIDVAKQKLSEMNEVAGKTVYKDVKVSTKPSITSINKDLASGVRKTVSIFTALDGNYRRLSDTTAKTVNIRTVGGYQAEPGYAIGTRNAPPGMAWVGENGAELMKFSGGEKVIPHEDSMAITNNWGSTKAMNLLKKWNIPMFASGTTNAPRGLAVVGEKKQELVYSGRGQSSPTTTNNTPINITLHYTGNNPQDAETMADILNDRLAKMAQINAGLGVRMS